MNKQQQNYDTSLKIIMIGNSGVGKTGVLIQFCEKKFSANYYNTIGVDFVRSQFIKKIKFMDIEGKRVKIQIWDTAGQDRFRTITSSYYRGANGIIIVYDITDRTSFESVRGWLSEIDKYADNKIKKYLVGNKCDLQQRRQVKTEQGIQLAKSFGIPFIQTSARTSTNIENLYKSLAKMIMLDKNQSDYQKEKPDDGVKKLIKQRKQNASTSYCC